MSSPLPCLESDSPSAAHAQRLPSLWGSSGGLKGWSRDRRGGSKCHRTSHIAPQTSICRCRWTSDGTWHRGSTQSNRRKIHLPVTLTDYSAAALQMNKLAAEGRADALQMLCSHSVTVRCECTQSAVECEAMRGAWPVACAGRARLMRLGRLDLTPNLRAFWCRAPSCKSVAAAPTGSGPVPGYPADRAKARGQPLALASCAVLAGPLGALARATRVLHR